MILVLGKGIANDGVVMLLKEDGLEYDYLNLDEVSSYDYDLVVKAPGIPIDNEIIKIFKEKNIKVMTDIELGMSLRKKYYIGVTGSNGKTTTVSLIYHILKEKYNVVLCGNIGYAFCRALVENKDTDIFIIELSSFQLECVDINLNISVVLNINPCHMDHHKNFKEYVLAKENICKNQNEYQYFIYNYNDPYCRFFDTKACKISFSKDNVLADSFYYRKNLFFKNMKSIKIDKYIKNKVFLVDDYLASINVVSLFPKIKRREINRAIKSFKEIEFRMSKINDYIYNDAKSTNPYSTIEAINNLENIYLICGGYDRGEELNCLIPSLDKISTVFAYGESKNKIYNFMIKNNKTCFTFSNLEEVIEYIFKIRIEEIILYSPMFASFDQYNSYIERGREFNKLIKKYI